MSYVHILSREGYTGDVSGIELRPDAPMALDGASIRVFKLRPDLDGVLSPPRGWHCSSTDGDIINIECRPTDDELLEAAFDLIETGTRPQQWTLLTHEQRRAVVMRTMIIDSEYADHLGQQLARRLTEHLAETQLD